MSVEMTTDEKFFEADQQGITAEDITSLTLSDVSYHSAHEDTNVNLYSHINCPVLTSDILMSNYAKYLNHFSARPLRKNSIPWRLMFDQRFFISDEQLKRPSFGGASISRWLSENRFEFVQVRVE